eukprot:TRINITY_DN64319_c0_g1_i2.p2 TRINITY_DN64319_c0_g1~~TRINITY_DN64319_c0_g1_i2.p2  ORF type:complete len:496 (-),score=49.71 TRINITY_DN64319_c0_g1_i2:1636-3123(-)
MEESLLASPSLPTPRPPTTPRTNTTTLPRSRRHSLQWEQKTRSLIQQSTTIQERADNVLQQSITSKRIEQRMQRDQDKRVTQMIKQKVHDTSILQKKLQTQLDSLTNELRRLELAKEKAQVKLDERTHPLQIAEGRLQMRAQQPTSEVANDVVERALQVEWTDLKCAVDQLDSIVHAAELHTSRINAMREILQQDIEDKEASLKLDQACLRVSPTKQNAQSMNMVLEAAKDKTRMKKSCILPDLWKKGSLQELEDAAEIERTAIKMRKVINKMLKHIEESNVTNNSNVNEALHAKLKLTTALHTRLTARLSAVETELQKLNDEKLQLEEELKTIAGPLEVVQQRISLRNMRPGREAVRDGVEEALESQLAQLQESLATYKRNLSLVDSERNRMLSLKAQIEQEMENKAVSLKVHTKCLDMDSKALKAALGDSESTIGKKKKAPARSSDAAKRNAVFLQQAITALSHTRFPRACFLTQRDLGATQLQTPCARKMGW